MFFTTSKAAPGQQLYVEDDPYDMDFTTAVETAAAFRRDGGFRPVQNDLLGSSDWHEPAATGRFIGERRIVVDIGGTAAAARAAPCFTAVAMAAAVANTIAPPQLALRSRHCWPFPWQPITLWINTSA